MLLGGFFFFCIYQRVELLHHLVILSLKLPYYLLQQLHHFTFSPTVQKGSISPYPCKHDFVFVLFFIVVILMSVRWYLFVVLICVSIMISGRRQWHPTPVLLPGKSHRERSLVGCSPWGREESDTTERLHFHFSFFTFMRWRRKWQPTPVFLPGKSQGWGSLVGCCLWGHTELDTTEAT